MMPELETLIKFWPIFVGYTLLVGWFIRLEASSFSQKEKIYDLEKRLQKEIEDHKKDMKDNVAKMWEKIDTIKDQNTEILKSISRLEGKLERRNV